MRSQFLIVLTLYISIMSCNLPFTQLVRVSTPTPTPTPTKTPTSVVTPTSTSVPIPTATFTALCESYASSMDLSASTTRLKVGEVVTITATLNNEGCVNFGLPEISLSPGSLFEPSTVISSGPGIHRRYAVSPGYSMQVDFVLQAVEVGKAELNASSSFEVHRGSSSNNDYGQWVGGRTKEPLVIEVVAIN
jgi:hypothetical protein